MFVECGCIMFVLLVATLSPGSTNVMVVNFYYAYSH